MTTIAESGAFVDVFDLPPTDHGPLDGLRFAVKELIDVGGHRTGCGNPTWRATHPAAAVHAVCVDQLLSAGGRCVGSTVTDELAFSLLGENHHHGTPLNPRAPERVPGGSSSGSASAVACGAVDLALGTDTGGSVRVPASNCGIYGFRPSHGLVSVAGVNPLSPTFDTVGLFARDTDVLSRGMGVLLGGQPLSQPQEPGSIYLLTDAFTEADPEVTAALEEPVERLRTRFGPRVRRISLGELEGDDLDFHGWPAWCETYNFLAWAEIWSCLGSWIIDAQPEFGPNLAVSFELPRTLDRRRLEAAIRRRTILRERLASFLGPTELLCMPTTPTLAPLKGSDLRRDAGPLGFFARTLSYAAVAGIGRLPQVSVPAGTSNGVPVGLSFVAGYGRDMFLLEVARQLVRAELC